jgi:hypothetical protein
MWKLLPKNQSKNINKHNFSNSRNWVHRILETSAAKFIIKWKLVPLGFQNRCHRKFLGGSENLVSNQSLDSCSHWRWDLGGVNQPLEQVTPKRSCLQTKHLARNQRVRVRVNNKRRRGRTANLSWFVWFVGTRSPRLWPNTYTLSL